MGNTLYNGNLYTHYPVNFPCKQLEETSFSDLVSLKNCILNINGQNSNIASSTDIYYKIFLKIMKAIIS
jgi:hypothetical protein